MDNKITILFNGTHHNWRNDINIFLLGLLATGSNIDELKNDPNFNINDACHKTYPGELFLDSAMMYLGYIKNNRATNKFMQNFLILGGDIDKRAGLEQNNSTAYILACCRCDAPTISFMQHYGCDPYIKDANGFTGLEYATEYFSDNNMYGNDGVSELNSSMIKYLFNYKK